MTDPRPHLRALAEATAPGGSVLVPREWILALLSEPAAAVPPPRDLTVMDLCKRFGRKPSAVRAWLEQGDFPGAYKLRGRDWRVPAAAVEAFTAQQGIIAKDNRPGWTSERPAADLGAWRRYRRA